MVAKMNHYVLTILFIIPLTMIALWESTFSKRFRWMDDSMNGSLDDECPEARDPETDEIDANKGLSISKTPFSELVKVFPNTHEVSPGSGIEVPALMTHIAPVKRSYDCQRDKRGEIPFGCFNEDAGRFAIMTLQS